MALSDCFGLFVTAPKGALLDRWDNVCRVILDDWGRRSVGGDLLLNIPLFYGQALGNGSVNFCTVDLAVRFSIRSTVCHVCLVIPWFFHASCSYFVSTQLCRPRGLPHVTILR